MTATEIILCIKYSKQQQRKCILKGCVSWRAIILDLSTRLTRAMDSKELIARIPSEENSIPSFHRRVIAAILTSPSLILCSSFLVLQVVFAHSFMPPSIDLQRFRDELEQLYLTEGYTHQQLAHWLPDRGLVVAPPNP
jgi:hypothetical protein